MNELTTERKKKLEESFPELKWIEEKDFDSVWEEKRQSVIKFKNKSSKFPSDHSKDREEKRLGSWIGSQRKAKKGIGTCKLTSKRIKLLEKIPGWEWSR